jgi:hypothetical protein
MEDKIKKLIGNCSNTKSAFTRTERFVDNYAADPSPERLSVRLKLIKKTGKNTTKLKKN